MPLCNNLNSLKPITRLIGYFSLIMGLLVTTSCQEVAVSEPEVILTPVDTFLVSDPRLTEKLHQTTAQHISQPARLAIYDPGTHAIHLADLSSRSITRTIPLIAEGPNGFGPVRAMSFVDNDRLAIYSAHYFGLIDYEGNVMVHKRISAGAEEELRGIDAGQYHPNSSMTNLNNIQFAAEQDALIVLLNYFERDQFDFPAAYEKDIKILAQYELSRDSFHYLPISYPEPIRNLKSPVAAKIHFNLYPDGRLLYLFEGLSDHFIHDLKNGTTQVIERNYTEFSTQAAPYAGVPTDYSAILRHASKYTNYLNVLFDAENDRYYQLVLQPVPDTNGGMKSYLLVFDGELRYLGSAAVPRGARLFGAIVYEGKILLPSYGKERDEFGYYAFEIRLQP